MKTKLKSLCQSALRTLALVAGIAFAASDAAAAALPYTSTQTYTQDGTYQMYIKYQSSVAQTYTITINLYKASSATGTPVATWTETTRSDKNAYEATHSTTLKMTASTAYTWQVTVTASDASKVTITSGPTFSEIGSTYLWNGGSSGVWSTPGNWKFQDGTRNKIPTKLDNAYIEYAATIDLNNAAVEVPGQVAFRGGPNIMFKNGSFQENNGAASAPGYGHFFMKQGGTFDSINFGNVPKLGMG